MFDRMLGLADVGRRIMPVYFHAFQSLDSDHSSSLSSWRPSCSSRSAWTCCPWRDKRSLKIRYMLKQIMLSMVTGTMYGSMSGHLQMLLECWLT